MKGPVLSAGRPEWKGKVSGWNPLSCWATIREGSLEGTSLSVGLESDGDLREEFEKLF